MLERQKTTFTGIGAVAICTVLASVYATEANAKKHARKIIAPVVFDAFTRKKTKSRLNQTVSYSAYTSLRFQGERNLKFDDGVTDASDDFAGYIGTVLRAELNDNVQFFGHAELDIRHKSTHSQRYQPKRRLNIKEAQASFKFSEHSQLTVGRLRFADAHKWIADASVDGVHYGIKTKSSLFEAAIVQDLKKVGSRYALVHSARFRSEGHAGFYALAKETLGQRHFHIAGYTKKQASEKFSYALIGAAVLGDKQTDKSVGVGFDSRATYNLDGLRKPQITFGFAAGTAKFQQSGLHSNKTYDGGQTQFHRYGYVFQPELSNLAVVSVGLGLRPSRKFSLDLHAHGYMQISASTIAPIARVRGTTTGISQFVGTELNLLGAWRPTKKTKVEFGLGGFNAGSAYTNPGTSKRLYARFSMYL